jgi:hypothetical protein
MEAVECEVAVVPTKAAGNDDDVAAATRVPYNPVDASREEVSLF